MIKSCGGCAYWMKRRSDKFGEGLCDRFDRRASSDSVCNDWCGIPYNRNVKHKKQMGEK